MRPRLPSPAQQLELFALANLGFLGLDIALAHGANAFARADEWIPILYSGVAVVALAVPLRVRSPALWRAIGLAVGAGAIAVGVAGSVYHLHSAFFVEQTLHALVYSAPFIAPLSYVGVGLLLVLNRMVAPGSPEWARWVVFLALGGFAGNFGLSLLDHAQNGFFRPVEWVSVAAAALGTAFLAISFFRPSDAALTRATLWVLALQAAVGVLGSALHGAANLHRPGADLWQQILYGAPAFAPLLFTNLALLALIGLAPLRWQRA